MPRKILEAAGRQLYRAVDHAVLTRALTPPTRMRDPIERLEHEDRMAAMGAFIAFYEHHEHAVGTPLFTRSGGIAPDIKTLRPYGKGGRVFDLTWRSDFSALWRPEHARTCFEQAVEDHRRDRGHDAAETLAQQIALLQRIDGEIGAARYGAAPQNATMRARWFRHGDGPRPCAVILHGYLGGRLSVEERMWPIRALFDGGMDVVLTVLPHHGPRANPKRRMYLPEFPSSDPRLAIEGFRHLVHDHLSLFDYLLDGRATSLGTIGMSLGGYSAALLSTLDPRVGFGAFYMPLASVSDFALRSGRMTGTEAEQVAQAALLERTYRVVSPMARPPLLPRGRTVVIAGQSDLITGMDHGRRIADHFQAPLNHFPGGHILQAGRGAAFAPMWAMLEGAGVYRSVHGTPLASAA